MKKIIFIFFLILIVTGCSIVRIDTSSIDNILNVILTKDNKLYNQVGQGYKYYVPSGVTYVDSDDLNDILYCNGTYYYLYIDTISYYYDKKEDYEINKDSYYSKVISKDDGFKYSGYIEINKDKDMYYINFVYNHARIETIVDESELETAVLNSSYILSTIKYNRNIVELLLEDDYFTNKTGKYNNYNSKGDSEKFVLEKENVNVMEEG